MKTNKQAESLASAATIESPCVRNCCLNDQDYCLGCSRHLDEITGWSGFDDQQKRQVLALCQLRRKDGGN